MAISDELGVYTDVDDLLRHAVGFARERLKLERVAIFLRDAKNALMRGTYGTGASGETTDERWHAHPVTNEQCDALRQLVPRGMLWDYYDGAFANARVLPALLLGAGANYTHEHNLELDMTGKLNDVRTHLQVFGAAQYMLWISCSSRPWSPTPTPTSTPRATRPRSRTSGTRP